MKVDIDYTSSGMKYTCPDWTNFGVGNGGIRCPSSYSFAHSGKLTNLATPKPVEVGSVAKVSPRTTVVIFQE